MMLSEGQMTRKGILAAYTDRSVCNIHMVSETTGAESFRPICSTRKMLKKEKSQEQHLRGGWKNNHQQRIARESSHNVKGRTGEPGIKEDRSRDNFWKRVGNSHINA